MCMGVDTPRMLNRDNSDHLFPERVAEHAPRIHHVRELYYA